MIGGNVEVSTPRLCRTDPGEPSLVFNPCPRLYKPSNAEEQSKTETLMTTNY